MQIFNVPSGEISKTANGKQYFTDEWQKTFTDLFQQAQRELGSECFLIPAQPTATVSTRAGIENNGALMVDTEAGELIININGALYKISVTAL